MTVSEINELEQFLYREAALIDERRYDEWLALMTDDVAYWIPNYSELGERRDVGVVAYERLSGLQARVARANHSRSPMQLPVARTRQFVTNVIVDERTSDTATVTSNLLVYISHDGRSYNHAGKMVHRLRRIDGSWRIAEKKISLIDNDQPLSPLPIL